ncbi:intersectin-1 isoform X2 [Coccinella septempunctata]|uniref:intersectin-1 isoform X2 n=1 Tax=Coccinella septempunctata TaxID=41139 RepID=UPI001D05F8A9|nr:intersectin-1 isoform X2 [Coccinella septempunctata]
MMSAAGTPSSDPWVILQRERLRYEEQFRSLKPVNGIITGEQAKGFFLQSQLPPLILGQIWALADTDSDGKMNIDEFSIACKLINLKLRGYDVPKMLPPTLLASLKAVSTPAIPPLPNAALINAPPRPDPPKIPPVTTQPLHTMSQPVPNLLPNLTTSNPSTTTTSDNGLMQQPLIGNFHPSSGIVPTGIVTPMPSVPLMQTSVPLVQPSIPMVQPSLPAAVAPRQPVMPTMQSATQPAVGTVQPSIATIQPTMASLPSSMNMNQPYIGTVPPIPPQPLIPGAMAPGAVPLTNAGDGLLSGGLKGMSAAPVPAVGDTLPNMMPPSIPPAPIASSTPRASVTSLDKAAPIESPQAEWTVPHQTRLKYTQLFNTTDRTRSGFLSGVQARNIMIQSKLPQNILAQIWSLSDMDADGRLSCEEFVLAMHLCEQASAGHPIPVKLPLDLIPPSFRKTTRALSRTASISSQGSAPQELDPASTLLQTSFEDKRKENFEKGQAELERRRKQLLDQQRKEAEERERKEREEIERREKARQEAERKRLEELEKQMREQQEQERIKEEERKRQAEQREAARKEMERQRQLEWEKQRLQELQQQRQREQENVLKLKAKNQSLTIELSTLNEQVKDLSQKICDTRLGVSNVKSTIDGMRTTRDTQMQEMSQLKNKLKEQNAKLLALSQEKIKLEARNKQNQLNGESDKVAFESREINIKNLREKVADMQEQIKGKMSDIENNNSVLNNLKSDLQKLVSECETLYQTYEQKRDVVLDMKKATKSVDYSSSWKDDSAWNDTNAQVNDWPTDNWQSTDSAVEAEQIASVDFVKYRALYEFVARNQDEISFQPGDIINVPKIQNAEPGWLAGEIRGQTGWFPESYVEPVDGVGISGATSQESANTFTGLSDNAPLEGIAEISETTETVVEPTNSEIISPSVQPETIIDYYVANYPYQSQEPGDLTFNAGDVIAVIKQEGEWWTGKLKDNVGIFPSNYVQKVNNSTSTAVQDLSPSAVSATTETSQVDNEVSQINEAKHNEIPFDSSISSNAQVVRTKKPEIASVIAPYQATSQEQLSLQRGQLIMIRKKTDSGWWEGELQAKGRKRQVGWFPASYVKILNSSGRASGRTTPVSTTRMQQEIVLDKVIALYPYSAGNPDELSFNKDDIISVTAREEEAWWKGELNGVSGLFPSNYVAPLQQQSPFHSANQRQECIRELVDTERAYVKDLKIVCKVFEQPLKKNKIISNKDISRIFLNWEEILRCNQDFLRDLSRRLDQGTDAIGDIILYHLPEFTPYISFCTNELDGAELLQKLLENSTTFKYFLKKAQLDPSVKGMPLSSFLIKPMQRITKYPLIIGKILENTDEIHKDHKHLKEALQVAEEFLNCINENIRVKENLDRMDWLQKNVQNDLNLVFNSNTNKLGPRKLLHFGVLSKLKSGKELIAFLFNDMFLLVQPNKASNAQFSFPKGSNNSYKLYRQPVLIQNLSVSVNSADTLDKNTDSNRVLNVIDESTKLSFLLLAPTVNECSLWIKSIDAAKLLYSKIFDLNNTKSKKKVHIGPACGRLLIVVQKGQNFVSMGKNHVDNIFCKVTLGDQELKTDIAKESASNSANGNPHISSLIWNNPMQFHLKNIHDEVVTFEVFELSAFTPDVSLGRCELRITDILRETENSTGPIIKKLLLRQAESGELTIKLDLQLFKN